MALTPWNRQEEWYQQMINASTGNYLPSISAQDAGKVMTVESDGSWGVENIPSELPSVTSADETKVLTVDSNGDWVAGDAPSGLPSTTSASAGDVISLNNDKEAVWTTPSSGGGALVVNKIYYEAEGKWKLDKTWQEIYDAMPSVIIVEDDTMYIRKRIYYIAEVQEDSGIYYVDAFWVEGKGLQQETYDVSSASGYPVLYEE